MSRPSSELVEELFNKPSLRLLPDTIFFNLKNGAIVPTDRTGLIYTKDEIKETARVLISYINLFPDSQVEALREEFFMKHFPERYGLSKNEILKKPKRIGFIYIILGSDNTYKIGYSKNLNQRFKQFQGQFTFTLIHKFETDDMINSERELHQAYQSKSLGSEWFKLNDNDITNIKSIIEYKNGQFVYRESE